MKNKIRLLLLSTLFSLSALTSCNNQIQESSYSEPTHTHESVIAYDDTYHWNVCNNCNEILTNKENHNLQNKIIDNPTCSENGLSQDYCSCGYVHNITLDKLNHTYKDNLSYNDEKHYYECENCSNIKDEAKHTLNERTIEEATTSKEGKKEIYCSVCDYKKEEIIPIITIKRKTIEITVDNLDEYDGNIEKKDVAINTSYPNEFTMAKETSYIKSNSLGKIYKIYIHLYGYGGINLKVYDQLENGTALSYTSKTKQFVGSTAGYVFEYDIKGKEEFRIENPATKDASLFSLKIECDGTNIITPSYDQISIAKALEIGNTLTETSKDIYLISGKITNIDNNYFTLTDKENNSIIIENTGSKENMYIDYDIVVKGKIEKKENGIFFVNVTLMDYIAATYSINVITSAHGSIILDKYSNINYNERINVTINPDNGYRIKELFANNEQINFFENSAKIRIRSNTTITYSFTKDYGNNIASVEYEFNKYESGIDNAENEEHILDSNTTLFTTKCNFNNTLTIHKNGSVKVNSKGNVKEISLNISSTTGSLSFTNNENNELATIDITKASLYSINLSKEELTVFSFKTTTNDIIIDSMILVYNDESNGYFNIQSVEMQGTYGDANLITYNNYDILIDGGTAETSKKLKEMIDTYVIDGVIDLLLISHPDSDHYAGITNGNPFEDIDEIKTMITNNHTSNDQIYSYVENKFPNVDYFTISELVNKNKVTHTINVDEEFAIDLLYHPGYEETNKNNGSLATLFRYKNTKLFMGGDMEQKACTNFIPYHQNLTSANDFVIFKALHHASNGSNKDDFLEFLKPDFAFVTTGMKLKDPNSTPSYSAHPYIDASLRIAEYTKRYYWSGINGQLTIKCDGYDAIAIGKGRSKDYYVYDKNNNTYIKADIEKEKTVTYFESYFYQNAIINEGRPNIANVKLYA